MQVEVRRTNTHFVVEANGTVVESFDHVDDYAYAKTASYWLSRGLRHAAEIQQRADTEAFTAQKHARTTSSI